MSAFLNAVIDDLERRFPRSNFVEPNFSEAEKQVEQGASWSDVGIEMAKSLSRATPKLPRITITREVTFTDYDWAEGPHVVVSPLKDGRVADINLPDDQGGPVNLQMGPDECRALAQMLLDAAMELEG